jgi:hypothetical protein
MCRRIVANYHSADASLKPASNPCLAIGYIAQVDGTSETDYFTGAQGRVSDCVLEYGCMKSMMRPLAGKSGS